MIKPCPNKLRVLSSACTLLCLSMAVQAQTAPAATQLPQGGKVVGGSATISSSGNTLTVQQSSQRAAIDWNSFNLGSGAQVNFNQPNAAAITLNRVLDNNPSQIMGRINAPGQVFIVNPNGVLFGATSQIDVGGLLVTTHGITNADFMAGKSSFEGNGQNASIVNQGSLQAAIGGYIALLAPQVRNEGVIIAREGTVAMAGGNKTTLVFRGQSLTALQIDQGVMDALVENKHVVRANGGLVLMTARSASVLMGSVVRNTGTLQAQTIAKKSGRIMLLGDMSSGTAEVDGTLDASAPKGGDGGFIETSAGKVKIADSVRVTTLAKQGKSGKWLIDPKDFTVGLEGSGADMSNTVLQNSLANGDVELQSADGGNNGSGDININADVIWNSNRTLTLTASNNVNVNANIRATGNTAGLVINANTTHTTLSGTQTASGSGTFNLQTGKEIVMSGAQANVMGARQVYLRVAPGQSVYASTPSVDYKLFDQPMGGNDITASFSLTGAPVWSVPNTASVGTYTLTYQNGLYLNQNVVTRVITTPSNWSVTPKVISYSGLSTSGSKIYDGTTNASVIGTAQLRDSVARGSNTSEDRSYITGDDVRISGTVIGTYNSKDVNSATNVTFSGLSLTGASSGNYSLLQQAPVSATITPKSISATGLTVASSKVYDGTTTAEVRGTPLLTSKTIGTGTNDDGLYIATDSLSVSGPAVGTYNSKDVATASSVTISGLTLRGTDSGNYSLTPQATANATITPKSISATGLTVASSKVYDGTTNAEVRGSPLLISKAAGTGRSDDGLYIEGDHVSLSGTAVGTYNSKDVNSAASVTFTGLSLTDNSGNYSLMQQAPASATITPKTIKATGLTAPSKVYDGTTHATLLGNPTLSSKSSLTGTDVDGLYIMGDELSISGTPVGTYNSKYVAGANTVNISGLSLGGNSSNNYILSTNLTSSITPKSISASGLIVPSSKIYDGTTRAAVSGNPTLSSKASGTGTSDDGLYIAGDNLGFSGTAVGTYNSKDVNSATSVTFSGLSLTGANSGNYSLQQQAPVSATITPKSISATGLTVASSKIYDGTTTAEVRGTPLLTSKTIGTGTNDDGLYIATDSLSVSGPAVGTYNSKDVATASSVTISGLTLRGTDSGNYSLTPQAPVGASITPKSIVATGLNVPSFKVYDGTTSASVTGTPRLTGKASGTGTKDDGLYIDGDDVSLSGTAVGTYNSKDIANANKVDVVGLSLEGSSKSNYSLVQPTSFKAFISFSDISSIVSNNNNNLGVPPTPISNNTARTAALANAGLTVIGKGQMSQLTPAELQAISPANFSALSPAQVANLSSGQFQLLSPSQLRTLSSNHIAALTNEQLQTLSTAQLNALTPTQVSALKLSQVESLSPTQLTSLNEAQIAALSATQLTALTPSILSKLRESQLQALTSTQLASLSNTQLTSLNTSQLQCLSCNQFKALSAQQIAELPPMVFKAMVSSKITCIKPQQLAALSESQMAMLSTNQISQLTAEQLQALNSTQLSVLTSVQIQRLKSEQVQTLLPTQVATLSSDKLRVALKSLTVDQMQALSTKQVANLTVSDVALLNPLQLQSLSTVQIAALAPEFVAQLSKSQLRVLLPNQVAALQSDQLKALTSNQIMELQNLQLAALSDKQLAALRADQIALLNPRQQQALLAEQLVLLTPEQRQAFNNPLLVPQAITAADLSMAKSLNALPPSELTPDKLTVLTPQQLRLMSETQINAWNKAQISALSLPQLQSLTPEQIAAISPTVLASLDTKFVQNLQPSQVDVFTPAQLTALSPVQVQALSPSVVASLTPEQIKTLPVPQTSSLQSAQVQALSKAQIQALTPAQVSNLNPLQVATLSPAQLSALSPEQFSVLKTPQLQSLNQAQINGLLVSQIQALSNAQISSLRPDQVLALNQAQIGTLSPAQIAALQVKQLQALQENQIAVLNFAQLDAMSPTQLQALTPNQITALSPSLFGLLSKPQVEALTRTQFAVLTPQAIAAMGETQLNALNTTQISAINAQQLAALSASQLQSLSPTQLAAINPAQLVAMSNTQLQSISPQQIGQLNPQQLNTVLRILNPDQLAGLTKTQVASMDINQLRALSPEQLQTLADRKMITLATSR